MTYYYFRFCPSSRKCRNTVVHFPAYSYYHCQTLIFQKHHISAVHIVASYCPNSTRRTRTGPDPTRQSVRVSGLRPGLRHVWFWLNSTRARPDFVVDFPRKTRLEKPNLCKDGRRQRNCCRFSN